MAAKKDGDTRGDTIKGEVGDNASNVIIGKGNRISGDMNVADGDITNIGGNSIAARSAAEATKRFVVHSKANNAQLNEQLRNYQEVREQAMQWSTWSIVAAVIGFLLVGIAVVLYLVNSASAGVLTVIVSAISQALAAIFARQSKAANAHLDKYHAQLLATERKHAAIAVVEAMENGPAKERMIGKLLDELLPER